MALESGLRKELQEEIEAEVEAIRRRAEEQGEALLEDAEKSARRREEGAGRDLAEECDLRLRRALARKELEQRNALLRWKRREIDRVFEQASQELIELRDSNPKSYDELMGQVLDHCRRLLPDVPLRVRIGSGLEKLRARASEKEEITVEEDDDLFGVVVEADQGHVHCDMSVPGMLRRLRQEREADLAELLFGESS